VVSCVDLKLCCRLLAQIHATVIASSFPLLARTTCSPAVRLAASFSFYLLLQLFLVQIPRSKIKTIQAIVALLLLFSYEHG